MLSLFQHLIGMTKGGVSRQKQPKLRGDALNTVIACNLLTANSYRLRFIAGETSSLIMDCILGCPLICCPAFFSRNSAAT